MGDDAGSVEGVDEPVIGLGVVEEGADGGDAVRLREREEEEAEARGFVGGGGGGDEAVVLIDHVVEILLGGDGDEGVEVLVGELVFEGEGAVVEEGGGEAGGEGGEVGVPVDDDDAGGAADIAEGLVMGAGDYVSTVAAHHAQLSRGGGR